MKRFRTPPFHRSSLARTPLFATLRRAMRLASVANHPAAPPPDEMAAMLHEAMTRRHLLKATAAAGLAWGASSLLSGCNLAPQPATITATPTTATTSAAPRIVVVGAGIAGLNAAYKLQQGGFMAEVYEGSNRTGGRMYTATDLLGPGVTTELGGEFIDSGHEEMLALAEELGLELVDTLGESTADLSEVAYHFDGVTYTQADVVEAFSAIVPLLQADYDSTGDVVNYEEDGGATALDNLSIADYLDRLEVDGWFRELLDVAYVTEYGLEADQQSALNLLYLISLEANEDFWLFGDSDERYKIQGGNQRVVDELANRVQAQLHTEQRLEAISSRGVDGFTLSFLGANGAATEVDADLVLMTIPFTTLRDVDVRVELPDVKRKAIAELGYGTNAKVMVGFERPVWQEMGFLGDAFTDEPFQCGWDNSLLQGAEAAGFTFFSGGQAGLAVGEGTPEEQAARLMPGLEAIYPGVTEAQNGNVARFHWPTHEWTKGSYSVYKPGQWTTIAGAEIVTVGNLFFAGEHCSYDYQGYMNGGADTGRTAAEAMLERLGGA